MGCTKKTFNKIKDLKELVKGTKKCELIPLLTVESCSEKAKKVKSRPKKRWKLRESVDYSEVVF